ncbi:hypothetical protein CRUP_019844 [Coryphaenoides rupestris]|nr:hypothetical protein CRUP_019844 [Coryphaenoides rupestris]
MALQNGYVSINSTVEEGDEGDEGAKDSEPLIDFKSAPPPRCCSARYTLAVIMFLGFSVVYGLRVNLSVAMVAMVNNTDAQPAENRSAACPPGWLLGAFFFGYLCTQIPGGYLAGHYGGTLYLGGCGGCLWAVLWFILVADDPRTHRRIRSGHGWSVPVLRMALSAPLWAIIITQMCSNWSYYVLLTTMPTYMNNMLYFDLSSASCCRRGVWLLALPAVTLLTMSSTLGGASAAGVYINQIDIAPRYAGVLLGITNTFGTIPGVLAPIVTGYLTEDHSLAGWRKVFWVSAGINAVGALVYTCMGSAVVQTWALTEEERAEAEAEEERKRADAAAIST